MGGRDSIKRNNTEKKEAGRGKKKRLVLESVRLEAVLCYLFKADQLACSQLTKETKERAGELLHLVG